MKLIWARMSGVVIWYEHECPGWSFDVSTNVRGGHLMWARMSGWSFDVSTNVRGVIWCEHECPALSKIAWERMSVGTNVRDSFRLLGVLYILYIFMCVLQMLHSFKTRQVDLTQDARKKHNNMENIRRNLISYIYSLIAFLIRNSVLCSFRLMFNVILRIEYGAVRVKWHHFWIQHTWIYPNTSLALVCSIKSTYF